MMPTVSKFSAPIANLLNAQSIQDGKEHGHSFHLHHRGGSLLQEGDGVNRSRGNSISSPGLKLKMHSMSF